jgi:hypothetical protein
MPMVQAAARQLVARLLEDARCYTREELAEWAKECLLPESESERGGGGTDASEESEGESESESESEAVAPLVWPTLAAVTAAASRRSPPAAAHASVAERARQPAADQDAADAEAAATAAAEDAAAAAAPPPSPEKEELGELLVVEPDLTLLTGAGNGSESDGEVDSEKTAMQALILESMSRTDWYEELPKILPPSILRVVYIPEPLIAGDDPKKDGAYDVMAAAVGHMVMLSGFHTHATPLAAGGARRIPFFLVEEHAYERYLASGAPELLASFAVAAAGLEAIQRGTKQVTGHKMSPPTSEQEEEVEALILGGEHAGRAVDQVMRPVRFSKRMRDCAMGL